MTLRIPCLLACLCLTGLARAQDVPRSSHVWIIAEENHSYEDVVGNPDMPYYNQLIGRYALATQFYSDQHSSLPALMWFAAGAAIEPNNDTVSCGHSEDNLVRELLRRGYSWRSYQENLPYAGFLGLFGGLNDDYLRRHNPLIDFTDACPGTGQDTNSVPLTQMADDFAAGKTVNFAWITPDADEDAHNGTLAAADQWLQKNVPEILARPEFSPGGDGILFIVWDEGNLITDNRCSATVWLGCGGRTATLVIGPAVRPGYKSTFPYHSENVLKTVCAAMGLSPCPGAASNAAPMWDFFWMNNLPATPTNSVVITAPGNGATIDGAVHLTAYASENQRVTQTQVWDNGKKLGVYWDPIDQIYSLAPGKHTTTVLDLDTSWKIIHLASVTYDVQPLVDGVQLIAPSPGENIGVSTVHVVAQARESVGISQMQVWDDGVKLGWYPGATVNEYFAVSPGWHTLTVLDLDNSDHILHESRAAYQVE